MQLEVLVGMGECVVRHQRGNVGKLGGFGFQEFFSCGRVEKEIANGNGCSWRQARLFDLENFAAVDFDDSAGVLFRSAGFQMQAGDRGNRGQRFAAKSESGHAEQVFGIFDF